MSTYKITWLHDLYKKTFRKPKLSYNQARVNRENITKKGANANNKAKEGSNTKVPGTDLRTINLTSSEPINSQSNAKSIFKKIKIKSFSVLGERGTNYPPTGGSTEWTRSYDTIDTDLIHTDPLNIDYSHSALVDAGGLSYFIDEKTKKKGTGPKGAGFSSGELYTFIGIDKKEYFTNDPKEILETIKGIGDAKLITYTPEYTGKSNVFHIIHAIGPDLRSSADDIKSQINPNLYSTEDKSQLNGFKLNMQDVTLLLSKIYKNIFLQFIENKISKNLVALHIPPISAGSFSGEMLKDLTKKAQAIMVSIFNALTMLNDKQLNELKDVKILLCLWKGGVFQNSSSPIAHYEKQKDALSVSMGGYFKSRSEKKKNKHKKGSFRKYLKKIR